MCKKKRDLVENNAIFAKNIADTLPNMPKKTRFGRKSQRGICKGGFSECTAY